MDRAQTGAVFDKEIGSLSSRSLSDLGSVAAIYSLTQGLSTSLNGQDHQIVFVTIDFYFSLSNAFYFHRLEVVGRGSETQLQVGDNLKYLPLSVRGTSLYVRI